jgi:plastocyanin
MKRFINSESRAITGIFLFIMIMLVSGSCKKSSVAPGPNEVFIQGMAFTPSSITITANTTITWTNKDGVAHTVTSTTGLFDSGSINTNGTYSRQFTTTGTFPYKCTIHPSMTGTVTVN